LPACVPALALALSASPAPVDAAPSAVKQWGQWRGPLGTGVAPHGNPPVEWSEDKNVRWKTPLPGRGHSTPVVWGDRIFVTAAVPYGEAIEAEHAHADGAHDNMASTRALEYVVLALDRRDGSILWRTTVLRGRPHDTTHASGTWASGSAVTDGSRVYASFGSAGIYGLDLDGKVLWQADPGDMEIKHGHGEGSSPALSGDTLVVNWDHEGPSFVVAFDTRNGKPRWKVERDERTSWSTPLIVEHAGRKQVVVAATRRVRSYDLKTGEPIWECGGLGGNVVASPVAADGYVYVANSYDTRALLAIRLDKAKGDVTGTEAVAWRRERDTPYVPSPVLDGGSLCFLKHYQGVLTCVDARTGETRFGPRRLPGIRNVYASLAAAAGRIYVVDRSGTAVVLGRGEELEVLARNTLDDSFSASPAIVGNELFLRGEKHLYCLTAAPRRPH
jgi:outer membrane protein assembly factor BamB